jgi:hypothetical protein
VPQRPQKNWGFSTCGNLRRLNPIAQAFLQSAIYFSISSLASLAFSPQQQQSPSRNPWFSAPAAFSFFSRRFNVSQLIPPAVPALAASRIADMMHKGHIVFPSRAAEGRRGSSAATPAPHFNHRRQRAAGKTCAEKLFTKNEK